MSNDKNNPGITINSNDHGSIIYHGGPNLGAGDTNPKKALGLKKVQLGLVPQSSIIYQALAMQDGARKYGPYNWRINKVDTMTYIHAAYRHLGAYLDGEELTPDTGVPNLGAVLACIGIIIDAKETGNLVDDRPVKGAAGKLIEATIKKGQ